MSENEQPRTLSVPEMVLRDKALHASMAQPLHFIGFRMGNDPERPFLGIPANKFPPVHFPVDDVWKPLASGGNRVPNEISPHLRRLIQYACAFKVSFVVYPSPDIRVELRRKKGEGVWHMAMRLRGDEGVHHYGRTLVGSDSITLALQKAFESLIAAKGAAS